MTDLDATLTSHRRIVESEASLLVVLGSAGTGKTTAALAAARRHLERSAAGGTPSRVLFLSFSRTAVVRINGSAADVLGEYRPLVEVTTFHALAYSIVRRFGAAIGRAEARLVSPARQRLVQDPSAIGYSDLIPLALRILTASPAVRDYVRRRWGLIVIDEFQDTDDRQQQLVDAIAGSARLMQVGDPEQCIYTFRADDGVRYERIQDAARQAGPDHTVVLPEVSFRDPSGVIPAAARAIQRRRFADPAVAHAVAEGRLRVRAGIPLFDEAEEVVRTVRELRQQGHTTAVFTHHNDALVTLSDHLDAAGIEHEVAGLDDAFAAALDAQVALVRFAVNELVWEDVLLALAVFVTSAQRGSKVPPLAMQIRDGSGPVSLRERLASLRQSMAEEAGFADSVRLAREAYGMIGLQVKTTAWLHAGRTLSRLSAQVEAQFGPGESRAALVAALGQEAASVSTSALAAMRPSSRQPVQLMNLHQTKGREADATVIVLRERDFFGDEAAPYPSTSRLLYVVFSRARERIVVLLVGSTQPPAIAPLATLAE